MQKDPCGGLLRALWWAVWLSQLICTAVFAQDTQAPTTPTGFSAVATSSTTVVLNWLASTDNVAVTGYQLERCQGSGCTASFTQFNFSSPGWANSGLTPSTTYGYRVRAKDAVPNYSAFTSIVYVTTDGVGDTQAPTTPTGFSAVATSSTTVVLNWLASTDNVAVTGYQLERCQGTGCTTSFTQFNFSSPGWANSGLTPSTTYGYRVRAQDAVPNYSAFTSIVYVTTDGAGDTQAPTTPTGFSAVATSSTTVVLNWLASTDNVAVTGYQLERCQGSGCTGSFTQFNFSSPGWANSGLTPSTTYGYRVRAQDAVPNYSAFTGIVYVTTDGAGDTQAPTTPTNLSASAASSTSAVLNWTASTDNVGVASYQIERCQGAGCSSTFTQFSSSSNGWTDTGLAASTTYGFRVRALDAVPNYSAFTGMVYVTTPAVAGDTQPPTVPINFTAVASSSTSVVMTWVASTDNVGVTGYQVERCQGSGCTASFTQFNISPTSGWANSGLTPATTYGYRIRAKDAVPNYSAYTSIVYVTTLASGGGDTQAPTAPTGLTAVAGANQVTLSWTASTDNVAVVEYRIERCTTSACTYTDIGGSAGTSYIDSAAVAGTNYSYRVRARDAAPNYSPYSNIATSIPASCD